MKLLVLGSIACLVLANLGSATTTTETIWLPAAPGVVVIEPEELSVEAFVAGSWERGEALAGGGGYVTWRGPNRTQGGAGIVPYESGFGAETILRFFVAPSGGRLWGIHLLNYHLKEDGDNDVWVSVDGGDWAKFHDGDSHAWT